VRLDEVRPAEVRPAEVRPAEVRAAEVRPAEVRLGEVRPAEVRLEEVRRAEGGPAEIRLGDARPGEGRADVGAEVRTDVGVLVAPLVPDGHALLQQCDVLVVRHGSTPRSVRLVSASLHPFDGTTLLPVWRLSS